MRRRARCDQPREQRAVPSAAIADALGGEEHPATKRSLCAVDKTVFGLIRWKASASPVAASCSPSRVTRGLSHTRWRAPVGLLEFTPSHPCERIEPGATP